MNNSRSFLSLYFQTANCFLATNDRMMNDDLSKPSFFITQRKRAFMHFTYFVKMFEDTRVKEELNLVCCRSWNLLVEHVRHVDMVRLRTSKKNSFLKPLFHVT